VSSSPRLTSCSVPSDAAIVLAHSQRTNRTNSQQEQLGGSDQSRRRTALIGQDWNIFRLALELGAEASPVAAI
jgi:hypothetical protein